jgi:hypothetical protein
MHSLPINFTNHLISSKHQEMKYIGQIMKFTQTTLSLPLIATSVISAPFTMADDSDLASALINGKVSANFNLRYEAIEQDNTPKDADAFTLRTRLNYSTGTFNGFSAVAELENSTALVDDYKDAIGNGNEFSVNADPDHTELDQAYIAYKGGKLFGKIGRQVITMYNHRFVGHFGWRQDRHI